MGSRACLLALGLCGSGCGTSCPDPTASGPVQTSWTSGVDAGDTVVASWRGSTDDPLPDSYYSQGELGVSGEFGDVNVAARLTGPQQMTLSISYATPSASQSLRRVFVNIRYPDQRGFVDCSHPGSNDEFTVTLTLTFDPPAHTLAADLSPIRVSRGACAVGLAPGRRRETGASAALLAALGALVLARRRRRRSAGDASEVIGEARAWKVHPHGAPGYVQNISHASDPATNRLFSPEQTQFLRFGPLASRSPRE